MMMHTIQDLRRHLFNALDGLVDENKPMDVDRAEAIGKVAQVIVNTGRLECDYLEILGGLGTGFCTDDEGDDRALGNERPRLLTARRGTPK